MALMVQLPLVIKVSAPPLVTVHTAVVLEVKLTGSPELAVAVSVGVVPKFCAPGLAKVIVCVASGVVLFDAADGAPVPAELVAVTVKVYAVPSVRPVTTQGELAQLPVKLPGTLLAVYWVIDAPPVNAGGVKLIDACAFPAVAVPIVGAPGTTAATENDCDTVGAAVYALLPA